jgi:hypothetical protein
MPSRAHISRRAGTDPLIRGVVLPTQFVICRQEMKGYTCCVRRRRHPSILEIVHQQIRHQTAVCREAAELESGRPDRLAPLLRCRAAARR